MDLCDCCRWQLLPDAASNGVLLCSNTSDTIVSDLRYELASRIGERVRVGGGVAVFGDDASTEFVDAANLELAPILGETASEALRHAVGSAVAIGFAFGDDETTSARLDVLHAAGALTISVAPQTESRHAHNADFYVVLDPSSQAGTTAASLSALWRSIANEVARISPPLEADNG